MGGGGASAPSAASSAPATGNTGTSGASLPGSSSPDAAMARAQSQADQMRQSAPQAGQTQGTPTKHSPTPSAPNAESRRAAGQGKALDSSGPGATPKWQDKSAGTPAQETQKAGDAFNRNGVKQDAGQQPPEAKAQMQSALDNAGKNGQNGPQQEGSRSAAIREQAKSAPEQAAPSQSMDK